MQISSINSDLFPTLSLTEPLVPHHDMPLSRITRLSVSCLKSVLQDTFSVIPLTLLCLFAAMFLFSGRAHGQSESVPYPLVLSSNFTASVAITQEYGASDSFTLSPTGLYPLHNNRTTLLIQFVSSPQQRESVRTDGFPDIILYVATTPNQPLFANSTTCNCTQFYPCFEQNENVTVDTVAFFSHSTFAFVDFDLTNLSSPPIFGVINYDRGRSNASKPLYPNLNGTLVARLVNHTNESCPILPPKGQLFSLSTDDLCGPGSCVNGLCNCTAHGERRYGRFCEYSLFPSQNLSDNSRDTESDPQKTANISYHQSRDVEYANLSIPMGQTAVVSTTASFNTPCLHYIVSMNQSEYLPTLNYSIRLAFGGAEGDNNYCSKVDVDSAGKASMNLELEFIEIKGFSYTVKREIVNKFGEYYLSIHANESAVGNTDLDKIAFYVVMIASVESHCSDSEYVNIFPIELTPIVLSLFILVLCTIIIMLCLDYRHGFTQKIDTLSSTEVNRMYPVMRFQRDDMAFDIASQSGNTNSRGQSSAPNADHSYGGECPICICSFEENDEIRVLQCGHKFHAECIDVSLRTKCFYSPLLQRVFVLQIDLVYSS